MPNTRSYSLPLLRLITLATAVVTALAVGTPAQADGGGAEPSNAPVVSLNVTYYGNNNHCDQTNCYMDFWRLPSLLAQDKVTVAWQVDVDGPGQFLCLAGNIDDYDWNQHHCNRSANVVGSRTGERTIFTASSAASPAFLELNEDYPGDCACDPAGTYHFVVERIQHAIGLDLIVGEHIKRKGHVHARAVLTNGKAIPENLRFALTIYWKGHVVKRHARSHHGTLSFSLRLPRSAKGRMVSLQGSRGASTQYSSALSARASVRVMG